jgi:hypothetical protein
MHLVRVGLFAGLLALASAGCSSPSGSCDGGNCGAGGGSGGCFADDDCPDKRFFFCNTTTSTCEPACRQTSDCSASSRGMYALPECAGGLGCQCDEGKCVPSLCGSDGDCGSSQVCRSGACVAAPAASAVTRCVVLPDFAVVKAGSAQQFTVEAFGANDVPVVLKDGVMWTAGAGGMVSPSTGNSTTFTAGSAAAAAGDGPKATIGTINCSAKVETLDSNVAATEIAVIVTDELTGRGISGATVMASDPTGAPIGATAMTGTDANHPGYAKLTAITGNEVAVTVFSSSYNYLTIANYDTTSGASRFLSFVLRRHQTEKYGGQRGTFNSVPMTSNVHAGLAGMSIAGSITDLSFAQLLGNTIPTRVKIGSAIDQMDVPLPAGVYLGFSDQNIKTEISAQGLAGVCSAAKGGETAIVAGTCGTRTGWALSGDVPLGDLPIDAFANGVNGLKFDQILPRVLPIFKKFNSSIVRDVEFSLKNTPTDPTGAPEFVDAGTESFTVQNHEFSVNTDGTGAIPLAFNFVTKVPDLPKFRSTFVDGVVLLGGANVPGRGVVPLGLGVAINSDGDATIDKTMDVTAAGLAHMRMAPTHHGIEGSQYGLLAVGVSFKSFTDASAGIALSGIFGHPEGNKLSFDPDGVNPLVLPGPFPVMPEGAKYNYAAAAIGGLNPRTFRIPGFTTGTTNPVTAVRVAFTDHFDHRWVVLADPAKVATGFTLPAVPGATVDRTFSNGNAASGRSGLLVQTMRLSETPAMASPPLMPYRQLIEANNTNADRITDFTTAFSFVDFGTPTVEWTTPTAGGTITHGMNATLTVNHFKVGTTATDDGYVKVTFTGGMGCTDATGQTDMSMGKGQIQVTVPTTCMGTGIMATAHLVDIAGTELNPPVTSVISVAVN